MINAIHNHTIQCYLHWMYIKLRISVLDCEMSNLAILAILAMKCIRHDGRHDSLTVCYDASEGLVQNFTYRERESSMYGPLGTELWAGQTAHIYPAEKPIGIAITL